MTDDVPNHVQQVRDMTGDQLLKECSEIMGLPTVEPTRTLPSNFRDTDNDPED